VKATVASMQENQATFELRVAPVRICCLPPPANPEAELAPQPAITAPRCASDALGHASFICCTVPVTQRHDVQSLACMLMPTASMVDPAVSSSTGWAPTMESSQSGMHRATQQRTLARHAQRLDNRQ